MRMTCMVFLPFAVLTVSSIIGDELPRRRYTVNDLSSIADVQIPTCSTKGLYQGMLWEKHAGQPDDYVAEPGGQNARGRWKTFQLHAHVDTLFLSSASWLFGVFHQRNQTTHLIAGLAGIHEMREDMTVEWVDTARSCPGGERQIVGATRHHRDGIKLLRPGQEMTVFGHQVHGMAMQMHRMHHRDIGPKQAQVDRLAVAYLDGLSIR